MNQKGPLAEPSGCARAAVAFKAAMWGLLFLLPFPLVGRGVVVNLLPDAMGWALLVWGMARLRRLAPAARPLRALALVGLAASLPLVVRFGGGRWPGYWALGTAEALVAVVFAWKLAAFAGAFGRDAARGALQQKARTAAFLFTLGAASPFAAALLRGQGWQGRLAALAGVVLLWVVGVSAMVGLMASCARLCGHLARAGAD